MKTRRIGRFWIGRDLLETNEATVRRIMGRCCVVRCEMLYHADRLEYDAISPDFDEVEPCNTIPEYDVWITERGERIEFKRRMP